MGKKFSSGKGKCRNGTYIVDGIVLEMVAMADELGLERDEAYG